MMVRYVEVAVEVRSEVECVMEEKIGEVALDFGYCLALIFPLPFSLRAFGVLLTRAFQLCATRPWHLVDPPPTASHPPWIPERL